MKNDRICKLLIAVGLAGSLAPLLMACVTASQHVACGGTSYPNNYNCPNGGQCPIVLNNTTGYAWSCNTSAPSGKNQTSPGTRHCIYTQTWVWTDEECTCSGTPLPPPSTVDLIVSDCLADIYSGYCPSGG